MGRVCLILPVASASAVPADLPARSRRALEHAGHMVEIVAALDPHSGKPGDPGDGSVRWIASPGRGLSRAVVAALKDAESRTGTDVLIVLDPAQGYHPDDLPRLVEPLIHGTAEIAVALRGEHVGGSAVTPRRSRRRAAGLPGRVVRPVLGASDPFAGLIALTPHQARAFVRSFDPVGSRFAVDLLARSKGRRVEVPVRCEGRAVPLGVGIDDLRQIKRLADDRFGNASRLVQFCAVGASGMMVDLSCYALFQLVFSRTALAGRRAPVLGGPLDLATAGALAIALALTWNFSLNRRLTFNYARSGSLARQYLTYALSNAVGIALSFSLRLYLPAHVEFFLHHKLAAAVVGIVTATGISFSLSRWLVFSRQAPVSGVGSLPEPLATSQVV